MIPLKFSFESDLYYCSLVMYGRAHQLARIQVSPASNWGQHDDLSLMSVRYLPWIPNWTCPQPYIASRSELWQFAQQHPRLIQSIFQPFEKLKNNPDLASLPDDSHVNEDYKLLVFPCEDEPVYVVGILWQPSTGSIG
jgi:hypothetical protein